MCWRCGRSDARNALTMNAALDRSTRIPYAANTQNQTPCRRERSATLSRTSSVALTQIRLCASFVRASSAVITGIAASNWARRDESRVPLPRYCSVNTSNRGGMAGIPRYCIFAQKSLVLRSAPMSSKA